jgi:uridine kinase
MRPDGRGIVGGGTPRSAVRILGIAGPSGSGKTTLAREVAKRAEGVVFALDAYYRDQRGVPESALNVDVPEAIDADLVVEHLRALAAGRKIEQPVYDFATHSRTGDVRLVEPAPLVVVEGLFALYWPAARALMQTRVFVDLDHDQCLLRRIERDVRERRRTPDDVTAMYERSVRPLYDRFVHPTRHHADLILDGRSHVNLLTESVLLALEKR